MGPNRNECAGTLIVVLAFAVLVLLVPVVTAQQGTVSGDRVALRTQAIPPELPGDPYHENCALVRDRQWPTYITVVGQCFGHTFQAIDQGGPQVSTAPRASSRRSNQPPRVLCNMKDEPTVLTVWECTVDGRYYQSLRVSKVLPAAGATPVRPAQSSSAASAASSLMPATALDILGIKLGMTEAEARQVFAKKFEHAIWEDLVQSASQIDQYTPATPFAVTERTLQEIRNEAAEQYRRRQGTRRDRLALIPSVRLGARTVKDSPREGRDEGLTYAVDDSERASVIDLLHSQTYPAANRPSVDSVTAPLLEKYGKPSFQSAVTLAWVFDQSGMAVPLSTLPVGYYWQNEAIFSGAAMGMARGAAVPHYVTLSVALTRNGTDFVSRVQHRLFSSDVLATVFQRRRARAQQTIAAWDAMTTDAIIAGLPVPPKPSVPTPPPPVPSPPRVATKTAQLGDGVTMDFVTIQPGSFLMGCSNDDDCDGDKPAHEVRITRPFEIGVFEVSQRQWQTIMHTAPSRSTGDTLPVEQVSWNDVQRFLEAMDARRDGYRYRLPTEAEWEYAARAGSTGPFAQRLEDVAWFSDRRANLDTRMYPVGRKAPNAWGLYDMFGNAAEWVQDWHGLYTDRAATDPTGPPQGTGRVVRGGSTFDYWQRLRASSRSAADPAKGTLTIGFRAVRVPFAVVK